MRKCSGINACLAMFLAICLVLAPVSTAYSQDAAVDKIQDNELVVSSLDDTGQIKNIQVLNHLRILGRGEVDIVDLSKYKLTSIRNLYGSEKIQQQDGNLTAKISMPETGLKDIYYLAALEKSEVSAVKLPVSVQLDYYLDGKKLLPSDLAGQSGHLKIVCHMENLTADKKVLEFQDSKGEMVKKETEIYTPYVVSLSGWELPNSKYSNIKAPGEAEVSPEGVLVDVQGVTTVNWSVPLVPPKYPAKQYVVLEADAKDIELPSFKIAAIPIAPVTAEVDSLSTIEESFSMLYDGFDQIHKGVGAPEQGATLLFGLNTLKGGMQQVSGGLETLIGKIKQVKNGLSNPAFNPATYDTAKGIDASGNSPGVKDAVGLLKGAVDTQLLPAFQVQKTVLGIMENSIGKPSDTGQQPSATTSLYNDINFLKSNLAGTPAQKVITDAIEPKLQAMGTNVAVFRDGGNMITATGTMPFPASVSAVEAGGNLISAGLGKANDGLGLITVGIGQVDKDGRPAKVLVNGQPGTILYALDYMGSSIDGRIIPGITQLQEGTGKIGSGAGTAKEGLAEGLHTFQSMDALKAALADNVAQASTFLGKPEGAQGTVVYVFQTVEISKTANTMKYGLGIIALALILLFAIGRPPREVFHASAEEKA